MKHDTLSITCWNWWDIKKREEKKETLLGATADRSGCRTSGGQGPLKEMDLLPGAFGYVDSRNVRPTIPRRPVGLKAQDLCYPTSVKPRATIIRPLLEQGLSAR